jgi:hypothetical protein
MGLKMRKVVSNTPFDCAIRGSLNTIKEAHVRLQVLNAKHATMAALASQIELCDLLLLEISGIHTGLARDLEHTHLPPRIIPSHAGLRTH